jgi:hypothetical protein
MIASSTFFGSSILKTTTNCDHPDYDRLQIFGTLNNFCEMCSPTEHLSVDKVIMLYKGRVIFWQNIPKKHKRYGIKIYKLSNSLGYTDDVSVCWASNGSMPQLK